MAKSEKFARIKRDVLGLTAEIPQGRVATYAAIGEELDVMARHVAYILAMLSEDEAEAIPWHRVVGDGGQLKSTKRRSKQQQIALLASESVEIDAGDCVKNFKEVSYDFA